MTPSEFALKWAGSTRPERAAAHEHFNDLCRMLGEATPNSDPTGERYAFEKGAEKATGGDGFADVWKKGHFAWEYKGRRKDLGAAYKQLLDYREALENPPLLVVCDLERFEVHTNFTDTVKEVHRFTLTDLAAEPKEPFVDLVLGHAAGEAAYSGPATPVTSNSVRFTSVAPDRQLGELPPWVKPATGTINWTCY